MPDATPGETGALPAVRDLRRRAQLTQIEFAARLGVPVETIRNWEQGKRVAARAGAGAARRDRPFAGNRFRSAGHGGTVAGLASWFDAFSSATPDAFRDQGPRENAICWHGCFRSP